MSKPDPKPVRKKRPNKHRIFLAAVKPQYDRLLAAQNGRCAICLKEPGKGKRRFHIDHDHATMTVRGVLCFRCNSSLRYWMTPEWLRAAATYLDGKTTHTGRIIHGDAEAA